MKKLLFLFMLLPFLVNAQTITGVSPNSGQQGQVLTVSISGQNTAFQQGTNTVRLFKSGTTIFATSTTVTSPISISATFSFNATHPVGVYDVVVANYTPTSSLTLTGGFTLGAVTNPPSIQSISPDTAAQGQTLTVSITGQNTVFQQGTNVVRLYGNGTTIMPASTNLINDTLIQATFAFTASHPPGAYDVIVNNYMTSALTLASGFVLTGTTGPSLLAMSPATAVQGDTINAIITGKNTHFSGAANSVWLTNNAASINPLLITIVNDTALVAKFTFANTSPLGYYSAHVSNSTDGTLLKSNALALSSGVQSSPVLVSVSPASAVQVQTLSISITGRNTVFQQGTNTIRLYHSGTTINPVTGTIVSNDTVISANFSFTGSHPTGVYNVIVDNYPGSSSLILSNGFTLYGAAAVAITGVSPASANQNDSPVLTVTGLNTNFGSGSDMLWLEDIYGDTIAPASITIIDSTSIQAQFNFTTSLDTMSLVNSLYRSTTYIYPTYMAVINDSLIQGIFDLTGVDGGDYDILIQGSENIRLANGFAVWYPVSVNEVIAEAGISVFPNPSHGIFYVKIDKAIEDGDLTVMDLQGKVLLSRKNIKASEEVDLSFFPKGMYFIKLTKEGQIKTGKIIRQ